MIILALDQSTRISGWSVFEDKELKDFGHWTETSDQIGKRILNISNHIKDLVNKYDPDLVVFENIQLQNRNVGVDTFQKLAWVQGAIISVLEEWDVEYKIIYASEWRKSCDFLKGNDKHRSEQKKIAQQWVKNTYNLKCTQDEADAICIGVHAILQSEEVYDWSD